MEKPKPMMEFVYDWFEVKQYMQQQYPDQFNDTTDFWNYMIDYCNLHNDTYVQVELDAVEITASCSDAAKRVAQMLSNELDERDEDYIVFWVSW